MQNDISSPQTSRPLAVPSVALATSPAPQPRRRVSWKWLLAILFMLLLAVGIYFWQQAKINTLKSDKTSLQTQVSSLQTNLAQEKTAKKTATTTPSTPASSGATDNTLMAGEVSNKSVGSATVEALYKPVNLSGIWLEYGTSPDKLTSSTKHITDELGAGDANTYASQGFNLTGLQTGKTYFYQVTATQNGKTIHSGIASFTASK